MHNLTPSDYQYFEKNFCSPEFVDKFSIFRVDDSNGAEIVGRRRNAHTDYAGIVFPHSDIKAGNVVERCLKPDKPETERKPDGSEKARYKYLFPPGRSNFIYFPPFVGPKLLTDISKPVAITEGKKQLIALTRVAVADSAECLDWRFLPIALNGVWGWRGTDGNGAKRVIPQLDDITWQGRKVFIIFDRDAKTNESVAKARMNFGRELKKRGADVFFVEIPPDGALAEKAGIDDALAAWSRAGDAKTAIDKCVELFETATPFAETKKESQANQILQLAEEIELFHDSEGESYARIETGGHVETHRLRSKNFRDYLAHEFYKADGKSPSSQALQDAINSLSGKAKFEGEMQDVYIRLAAASEKIYLDLCNDSWQIVEIGADGFSVIEAKGAPVRFRRTKAMRALPTPHSGGDITKLKQFLNVDDENLTLIKAWLVNCFRPDFPFPILIFSGEQGTAKTTATRVCRALVDPNAAPVRSAPRDERDLMIAASNALVCAFDNLSDVSPRISDAFCGLSTSTGFGTRTLYENDEETIFNAKRPIILNGIGDIANRPDLLDRALLIKLEVIRKDNRKAEREFWSEFEKEKTSIFSALVEAASLALKNLENISFAELPRMADFAFWATAAECALGLKEKAFINAFTQNRSGAHSIVLEGSILAEVLQEYCAKQANSSGDSVRHDALLKVFFDELKVVAGERRAENKGFPKSPKGLRNTLERLNPSLREIGIFITFQGRTGANAKKGASVTLEYDRKQTSPTSLTSPSPQNKAENGDVAGDVAQPAENSNVTGDVTMTAKMSNVTTNVTPPDIANSSNSNGLRLTGDVGDVGDVYSPSYSNDYAEGKNAEERPNCKNCGLEMALEGEEFFCQMGCGSIPVSENVRRAVLSA